MSREDAIVLVSRALAVLLTLWVLVDVSYLPADLLAFRHYVDHEITSSGGAEYWLYWRHHYLMELSFLVTRIVGLSLMARWLFKGSPEVASMLLPNAAEQIPPQD
jgi:hypothetical protein